MAEMPCFVKILGLQKSCLKKGVNNGSGSAQRRRDRTTPPCHAKAKSGEFSAPPILTKIRGTSSLGCLECERNALSKRILLRTLLSAVGVCCARSLAWSANVKNSAESDTLPAFFRTVRV